MSYDILGLFLWRNFMSVLKYITYTSNGVVVQSGSGVSGKVFVERAKLIGTGNSTLTIYDGADATNGRIIALLACVANGADESFINEPCIGGVFQVLTTGSGLAQALIYDR
jgi:hypothetical protein